MMKTYISYSMTVMVRLWPYNKDVLIGSTFLSGDRRTVNVTLARIRGIVIFVRLKDCVRFNWIFPRRNHTLPDTNL